MSYYDVVEYLKECQQEKELQNKIAKEFKLKKAIKEGIHDIIAEESIIGQSGKKKIRGQRSTPPPYSYYAPGDPQIPSGSDTPKLYLSRAL